MIYRMLTHDLIWVHILSRLGFRLQNLSRMDMESESSRYGVCVIWVQSLNRLGTEARATFQRRHLLRHMPFPVDAAQPGWRPGLAL